jgi:hypothetical protein
VIRGGKVLRRGAVATAVILNTIEAIVVAVASIAIVIAMTGQEMRRSLLSQIEA